MKEEGSSDDATPKVDDDGEDWNEDHLNKSKLKDALRSILRVRDFLL